MVENAYRLMNQIDSLEPDDSNLCDEVRDLLYLYACEELAPEEVEVVEAHLATCQGCQAALHEHQVLAASLPSAFLDRSQ